MAKRNTPRKRRSFTREFKTEAVRLCKVGDRSITRVATDLDLTETALREWVRRAGVDAGEGPPDALTKQEREELRELRKRVKRLEMEREILKKAAASSAGRRNGAYDSIAWRKEAKRFSRPAVQPQRNHIEFMLAVGGQSQSAREVLA